MTRTKRASRAGEEGELFRLLVENVKDYAIVVLDQHGNIRNWNPGAERLMGYSESEIIGSPIDCFFTPEDVLAGIPQIEMKRALESGRGEDDRWHVRKDRSRFWCSGSMTPLWDDDGDLRGYAKIMRDLTDLRAAQDELARQKREHEQRRRLYEAALSNIPDFVYVFDLEHRFTYANDCLLNTWGRSWDEAIGKTCLELGYAPWHAEMHDREIDHVIATKQPVKGEVPFSGTNGARIYEYIFVPVLGGNGEVEAVAGTTRDVTERRGAEEALRASEHRFRGLMEQAPFSVQVFSADGRIVRVNRAWEEIWGIRTEQMADYNILHDRQLEAKGVMQAIRNAFAGEPADIPAIQYNPHQSLPGGNTNSDPGRWISAVAYPLLDPSGQVREVILVLQDITEQRLSAERLRQGEERTRLILESISDAFFAVDRQWRFSYVNQQAERLLQRKPGDLIGRDLWQELPGLAGSEFERAYRLVASSRATQSLTAYYPDHKRWYEVHVYPASDGISIYFRDVSERKRSELQLARLTHASEQQRRIYETALSNTADANFIFEPDGRVVYVNKSLLELWRGRELKEVVGKTLFELNYPADLAGRLSARIRSVVENKQSLRDETPYVTPEGERQFEYIFVPVLGEDGTVEAVAGSSRDITERKQVEQTLREAERQWRSLAEALPNLVWTTDADGRCDYLSSQWENYTGVAVSELLDRAWLHVIHPDDRQHTEQCWNTAVADKGLYDLEYRIRRYDGQYRWFKTRGLTVRDDRGAIVRWFGTCTDIEDQKQAVEDLRHSQERFRQLADAMPQIVWTARPDGSIDYQNRQWQEFTGLPCDVGNAGWDEIIHADDWQRSHEYWAQCVREGTPFEMELRLFDRRRNSYRWHLIRTLPAFGEQGIVRWYGTATDIDGQKRASQASRFLAEASAALSTLVDFESTLRKVASLAVPFFADWVSVDLPAEEGSLRRLAVMHQDPKKMQLVQRLAEHYTPSGQSGVATVMKTGQSKIVEKITDEMIVQTARDDEHRQLLRGLNLCSYICVPLTASGKILGALTFATAESARRYDRSDLALAEDLAHRAAIAIENAKLYRELQEADRRKDEFLATLAHELRNPLAPIRNSLQILKMTRLDATMAERTREMMERQVHHLVRLVDDLLDVSRVMRGKIDLRHEKIDLATVVARALETAQPLVKAQGHELSISLPSEPVVISADPIRLAQVVGNLVANAAKYTDRNGRIWVSAERVEGQAVLRVRDSGIGIAPDMLPKIFDLFVQVDAAAKRSQGGLGIGLTLVKNLVNLHHGTVEAKSEGLGQGSEFVVRLPLPDELPVAVSEPATTPRIENRTPQLRLLIVDDNRDAADSLAMVLELKGHEVQVAHEGPSALAIIKTYRPDLVLLDIGMPGMDGYEVARKLRQTPGLQKIELAALTGWGQKEDRRRSAEAGFNHHLIKPVDPEALEELLAYVAGKRAKS